MCGELRGSTIWAAWEKNLADPPPARSHLANSVTSIGRARTCTQGGSEGWRDEAPAAMPTEMSTVNGIRQIVAAWLGAGGGTGRLGGELATGAIFKVL